jgi:hypothetical protein
MQLGFGSPLLIVSKYVEHKVSKINTEFVMWLLVNCGSRREQRTVELCMILCSSRAENV